jgi:NlpC/P60 family
MADLESVMRTRRELVRLARSCVENQATIHYAETRPIPLNVASGSYDFTTDCSGFVTMLARWAGLPDPNGNDYSGAGYTGTLLDNLGPPISQAETWRGDLCVFGPGTGDHVVMLLEGGIRLPDPQVASHGQEDGPLICRLSVETRAHPAPQRFLRIMPPPSD